MKPIGISVVLALAATACSQSHSNTDSSNSGPSPLTSAQLHELYDSDFASLSKLDAENWSLESYDIENDDLFSKIFGGTSTAAVQGYYDARIHYAFSQDELDHAQVVGGGIGGSDGSQGWDSDPNAKDAPASDIGALNIGISLWLNSVVAGDPLTIEVDGQSIPIDSSRTGIMEFGQGYLPSITADDGTVIPLPPEYRESILMHEARHSDCTDGISQNELHILRTASSMEEVRKKIPLFACGHLHILCPSGDYQGMPACDAEKYGAYKVGAVFIAGTIEAQTDYIVQTILQEAQIDFESRYIPTDPTAPDEQSPNMSSEGLIK